MQKRKGTWKSEELAVMSQQLHQLLESGIPLISSLELLLDQKVIPEVAARSLIQSLKQGKSFSEALRKEDFPDLFISFIRAAEEHGNYLLGLTQCHAYYQSHTKMKQELIQSCTYPLIVLICVTAALTFMMTVVLPRFAELYQTLGVELPGITQYMLRLTDLIQMMVWILAGMALCVLLIWICTQYGSSQIRSKFEHFLFRIPLIKQFYRFRMTHYVSIQLGSLLRSGVPLLKSLELMEKLSPWNLLSDSLRQIKVRLIGGISLHQSIQMTQQTLFLKSLARIVAIGEQSGQLDQSLLSLAKSTENLMKNQLNRWMRSLEPMLIFFLGIFIAITVIAMFLPMLQMVQAI